MTGPAKMRHAIAATIVVSFLCIIGYGAWWINGKLLPRPKGEWSTLHLADPVELVAGETTLRITRFVLNLDRETLTLEQDELLFNDYGDATRTGGQKPLTVPVRLCREDSNRFEIVLKNGFRQRFRLVVSPPPANTHLLIVLRNTGGLDQTPERILELRGPEIVPDELGDRPQPGQFNFGTLGYGTEALGGKDKPRLHGVGVSGSLATGGQVSIDPNQYFFHPDGSVGGTTDLGWFPSEVTFKPLGPDPSNSGRRVFALVPDQSKKDLMAVWEIKAPDIRGKYILVLGPTELSEHRLVIKSDGAVKQVLRLRNKDRDNHLYMLKKIDKVPADEREAFKELVQASGYQIIAGVDDGRHVTQLYRLQSDRVKLEPILARFPYLSQVHFVDGEVRKGP